MAEEKERKKDRVNNNGVPWTPSPSSTLLLYSVPNPIFPTDKSALAIPALTQRCQIAAILISKYCEKKDLPPSFGKSLSVTVWGGIISRTISEDTNVENNLRFLELRDILQMPLRRRKSFLIYKWVCIAYNKSKLFPCFSTFLSTALCSPFVCSWTSIRYEVLPIPQIFWRFWGMFTKEEVMYGIALSIHGLDGVLLCDHKAADDKPRPLPARLKTPWVSKNALNSVYKCSMHLSWHVVEFVRMKITGLNHYSPALLLPEEDEYIKLVACWIQAPQRQL